MKRIISSFRPGGAESASMSVTKPHLYSRLARVSISLVSVGMGSLEIESHVAVRRQNFRRLDSYASTYAEKLEPHPQVLVAFGFLKTNPRPMTSSLKSIS